MKKENLKISVIIPTYNRANYLWDTLKSLLRTGDESCNFEIIIIDNNSSDNTREMANKFIKNHSDFNISNFIEKNQGASFARNRGIEESTADILLFIDDDEVVGQNFIKNWLNFFEQFPNAVGGGGAIEVKFEDSKPEWISHFLMPLLGEHQVSNSIEKYSRSKFPFAGNMAWRKEVFEKYGKLETNLGRKGDGLLAGEEKEFYKRVRSHTDQIYHVPAAKVFHRVDKDRLSKDFIKKQALGLGQTIAMQLEHSGWKPKFYKLISELLKAAATIILSIFYTVSFQYPKAKMLLKFRLWIWKGYFSSK